ncbi:tocopherol cyclase family protein [Enterococcus hailinensis]|uniref:tocopherol cyclase family protein n=1 Tax=Enterococcus hailinensis TaxID=3238988 RepID=UPI0038B22FD2
MITTDRFFHANEATHSFFEGWYFKHQIGNQVYAFIPGISINEEGTKEVFIQVISQQGSHYFPFSINDFHVSESKRLIKIGPNQFSEKGITLALKSKELSVQGTLVYGELNQIKKNRYAPSIMGPFSYLSFMECYHGILSMGHTLNGTLFWNKQSINFRNGTGYIEKDWGSSFPSAYLWVQCNQFVDPTVRLFFSAADIPFISFAFLGVICVVQHGEREYRFSTYDGVKVAPIVRKNEHLIIELIQKNLRLNLEVTTEAGHALKAPSSGAMSRIIRENTSTEISLTLFKDNELVFKEKGQSAGFEEVGILKGFDY